MISISSGIDVHLTEGVLRLGVVVLIENEVGGSIIADLVVGKHVDSVVVGRETDDTLVGLLALEQGVVQNELIVGVEELKVLIAGIIHIGLDDTKECELRREAIYSMEQSSGTYQQC